MTCSLPGANSFGTVGPYQVIFGLALFMGGAAQLIAGIMEFTVGNTFGTTVHCSYGGKPHLISGSHLLFTLCLISHQHSGSHSP